LLSLCGAERQGEDDREHNRVTEYRVAHFGSPENSRP
jgi:hypothetical protein